MCTCTCATAEDTGCLLCRAKGCQVVGAVQAVGSRPQLQGAVTTAQEARPVLHGRTHRHSATVANLSVEAIVSDTFRMVVSVS